MKSKLFVIGKPITHSMSPTIHNFWIEKYSLNANYHKLEVEKKELRYLIKDLREEKIKGFNVTIPYKKVIIDFVDELEISASKSKAVNTVYKVKDKIIGANTDGTGFISSLQKDLNFHLDSNTNVMCVGAGGAAYGIISSLIDFKPNLIKIINRTTSEGIKLIKHFEEFAGSNKLFECKPMSYKPDNYIDLLINCTSCGMNGKNPLDIELGLMNKKSLVYDLVYKPSMTPLMKIAREKKISNTNGFYMLVRQASESFYRWFGVMPKDSHVNELITILKKND